MAPERVTRLLPWTGPEGKPCFLLTDDDGGYVSKVADQIESVQLGMSTELIGHARALLGDPRADVVQLRFLSNRLTEALHDAVRVAESRGARLSGSASEELGAPERPAVGDDLCGEGDHAL
jgi:hypothetical protein